MRKNNNINYSEFEEICSKIKTLLVRNFDEGNQDYYSYNDNYETRRMNLSKKSEIFFLSNGDRIKYLIPKSTVAHLLGIDTNYLLATGLFNGKDSYSILNEFVNDPYKFYKKHSEGIIDLNQVISSFIDKKLESFETNLQVNLNCCEFICKYQKERSYGYNDNIDMAYLILSKKDDNYYSLLLEESEKQKTGEKVFVPKSNQFYENYEDALEDLASSLYNQELTLINGKIITYGYDGIKKSFIQPSDRKNKMTTLAKWAKNLDCVPNVLYDLLHFLDVIDNRKNDNLGNLEALRIISKAIKDKKIIDFDMDDLPSEMIDVINACNDSLYQKNSVEGGEDIQVSKILSKNKELEARLLELEKENDLLKKNVEDYKIKYDDSEEKNAKLEEKIDTIKKVLG